jgi:hypothetical protein
MENSRMNLNLLREKKNNAQMKLSKLLSEMQNLKHAIGKKEYQINNLGKKIKIIESQPAEISPLEVLQYLEKSGKINIEEIKREMKPQKLFEDTQKKLANQ